MLAAGMLSAAMGVAALLMARILKPTLAGRAIAHVGTPAKPLTAPASADRAGLGGAPVNGAPHIIRAAESLPISFEPNLGQAGKGVSFLTRGAGLGLFLSPAETTVTLSKARPPALSRLSPSAAIAVAPALGTPETMPAPVALRIKFIGANRAGKFEGADRLAGVTNYFIGNDPRRWRTNVPTFAKVKYRSAYPGIDLVYYGNAGRSSTTWCWPPERTLTGSGLASREPTDSKLMRGATPRSISPGTGLA